MVTQKQAFKLWVLGKEKPLDADYQGVNCFILAL